jgi:hypothetical protein
LAASYHAKEKYAEVKPLYRRTYVMMKVRLGLVHLHTKTFLSSYADLLARHKNHGGIRTLISDLQTVFPDRFADEKETLTETST